MAYVLFVNPQILAGAAGPEHLGALLTSTALVAAVMTVAMGMVANLPLALAPGMGLNAVVAFQLVGAAHLSFAEVPVPLPGVVPPQATGAILVLVGFLMMREVGAIRWDAVDEAIPAFLTLTVMPFTCSITNGIGAGFLPFVVLKLLAGRIREVHPLMLGAAAAFLIYFALGG